MYVPLWTLAPRYCACVCVRACARARACVRARTRLISVRVCVAAAERRRVVNVRLLQRRRAVGRGHVGREQAAQKEQGRERVTWTTAVYVSLFYVNDFVQKRSTGCRGRTWGVPVQRDINSHGSLSLRASSESCTSTGAPRIRDSGCVTAEVGLLAESGPSTANMLARLTLPVPPWDCPRPGVATRGAAILPRSDSPAGNTRLAIEATHAARHIRTPTRSRPVHWSAQSAGLPKVPCMAPFGRNLALCKAPSRKHSPVQADTGRTGTCRLI